MTLRPTSFRTRLISVLLVLLAAGVPALADPGPAPPIVFDSDGRGTIRQDRPAEALPEVRYLDGQGELHPVYGVPWWYRPWWEYDPAGLYLYGDPYAGRRHLETLERVQWPGWCP